MGLGLQEPQLRTVANGYVRGALEYTAAAWLPAPSDSHVELLEREMRAAARVITGCPVPSQHARGPPHGGGADGPRESAPRAGRRSSGLHGGIPEEGRPAPVRG